ncbi:MAG: hypothetical protein KJ040_06725 [Gammaproteobacteria bacterium]|nr:hypothetical protein [Gammaproteobacteria bacterium]
MAPVHAAIVSTSVSASMQILDQNNPRQFADMQDRQTDAISASVDLSAAGALHVQSSMTFSSLTTESAVFEFLIGMHGNGYSGSAYLGAYGSNLDNRGIIHYYADTPMTATAVYDYVISNPGMDSYGNLLTFGMGAISINSPSHNYALDDGIGPYPIAGHYHSEETLDLFAGDNYFSVSFLPNVSGPAGWIDGQYAGTVSLNFSPVPAPAAFWLLGSGLVGLLGYQTRTRFQASSAAIL